MIRMYWQLPWTRSIQDTDEPLLELLQDVKITFRCCQYFFYWWDTWFLAPYYDGYCKLLWFMQLILTLKDIRLWTKIGTVAFPSYSSPLMFQWKGSHGIYTPLSLRQEWILHEHNSHQTGCTAHVPLFNLQPQFYSTTWSVCQTRMTPSASKVQRSSSVWAAPSTGSLGRI